MLIKAKTIKEYKLDTNDGELGKVKEFYFDDKHWAVRYLVADTGGWLTGRQVLISPYALESVNKDAENISINLSKKQIEDSPALDSDKPVSQQFEKDYYAFYNWPNYKSGMEMWGIGGSPDMFRDSKEWKEMIHEDESWDPHLRSTNAVSGLDIEASDGEIGNVEDFIIDDKTWAIRYLIIDTTKWFGGKKVLISPKWIDRISWNDLKVFVNLSREEIEMAPEYSEEALLTRDYETKLHRYYKRHVYWHEKPEDRLHIE